MATALILINSATGSDVCGNATLKGTAAATDGAGTTITLAIDNPSLAGVATDGSAWIQILDATAGARNFAPITAVNDIAKTVTVANAFGFSLSGKTWAINQTLASIDHANSRKLLQNNSGTGDALTTMPVRMQSGHDETLTSTLSIRIGSNSTGMVIFEGDPDAAVRPIIRGVSTNTASISMAAASSAAVLQGFDLIGNTGQTKSGSSAAGIALSAASGYVKLRDMVIGGTADNEGFYNGLSQANAMIVQVEACTIRHCYNAAVDINNGSSGAINIDGCYIDECDHGAGNGYGINLGVAVFNIRNTVVARCRGTGIRPISTSTSATLGPRAITGCTVYKCGGDGISLPQTSAQTVMRGLEISNCSITQNGGYGINLSGSGMDANVLSALSYRISNCNFGTGASANTSGGINLALDGRVENGTLAVDPAFVDPDNATESLRNFTPGALLKAVGFPGETFPGSSVRSYVDVGGVQRPEPAYVICG